MVYKCFVLAENRPFDDFVSSVFIVVEQRVAQVPHVYADLVGAPCFEVAFDQAHVVQAFQHFVMRNRPTPLVALWKGREFVAEARVPAHVTIYGAFVGGRFAPDQCVVGAFDRMAEKLFGQVAHGVLVFRYDQQAGGIFVYAVYQAHPFLEITVWYVHVPYIEIIGQPVDQGIARMAYAGVYHYPSRLMDHQQVIIFIADIERHLLGDQLFGVPAVLRQDDGDLVPGFHPEIRFDFLVVDQDGACADSLLDPIPRHLCHAVEQKFINAHGFLSRVHFDVLIVVEVVAEMFLIGCFQVQVHSFFKIFLTCGKRWLGR